MNTKHLTSMTKKQQLEKILNDCTNNIGGCFACHSMQLTNIKTYNTNF